MKCRFPGCDNEPTRWSRLAFCGTHRGAARAYRQRQKPIPAPPVDNKLRYFHNLQAAIAEAFPQALEPYARNTAGYEVRVLAPGGLRA